MKTKKQTVDTRTNPLREQTWQGIEDFVYPHLVDELYETAFDNEVKGVGDYGYTGDLPIEKIAERLTEQFLKEAQVLFTKMLVEAATLAQTEESIRKAGAGRGARKK